VPSALSRERDFIALPPFRQCRASNKSPQQAAHTLQDAAQQPEDARQEATHRPAEAAKNSHLQLLVELRDPGTQKIGPNTRASDSRAATGHEPRPKAAPNTIGTSLAHSESVGSVPPIADAPYRLTW
jgi:hypothetical protein